MRKLIEPEDFVKAAKLKKFGGKGAAKLLMTFLKLNRINRLYASNCHLNGMEFIDKMIEELGVSYEVSPEEISRIPLTGPFITISNHPFGGIDALLLVKIVGAIRPDFKVLGNFLLQKIEPVREYVMPVNPFEDLRNIKSSVTGIKQAVKHLQEGYSLGIFPAGEVSSYNQDSTGISDKEWQSSALKMIRKSRVQVIPVYFQGTNSLLFHLLGLIHPSLRTVRLPSELFNKRRKTIRIRIGNPISVKDQDEFTKLSRYGRFMRAKTYALGSAIEVHQFFKPTVFRSKKTEDIIPAVPGEKIEEEISKIKSSCLLFESNEFQVYCAPSYKIPDIMNELGRLREATFRLVGEGTNRSSDIDEYDLYYDQLFIWDSREKCIVGAYRVGKGKDIMSQFGVKGFYIQSLFHLKRRFYPVLEQSLELGRSFIVAEYQKKPLPLFMLWKGILYFLIKNPDYRYLIGPVSISNRFSNFSREMIIRYILENHYDNNLAKHIKPRKKFVSSSLEYIDRDIILESSGDMNKFDKFIREIDTSNYTMPVLLKKYLKQNGKIIGFNIDPKFNNALDGLLVLDLFEVPIETISSLSKEINDSSLLERFALQDIENHKD